MMSYCLLQVLLAVDSVCCAVSTAAVVFGSGSPGKE